jgi:hypothetical protein
MRDIFSVWRSLAARVPRVHEVEGSNPSTLTEDEFIEMSTPLWKEA